MHPLKTLVIGMGVVIVAGMAFVGYTIVKRANAPETPKHAVAGTAVPGAAGEAAAERPYGPVGIALPAGARILRTSAVGRRLIVELELAGGGERVLVIELATGALTGTIDLKAPPP
ncbi:MAG: hypothetical protein ACHQF3_06610 [Alphaproteobacteria bacterium]